MPHHFQLEAAKEASNWGPQILSIGFCQLGLKNTAKRFSRQTTNRSKYFSSIAKSLHMSAIDHKLAKWKTIPQPPCIIEDRIWRYTTKRRPNKRFRIPFEEILMGLLLHYHDFTRMNSLLIFLIVKTVSIVRAETVI